TWRVGTPAFQPNLPTAGWPVSALVTWATLPPRLSGSKRSASARISNVWSDTASTRPRPNSGVVRRPATTLAMAGTVSPTIVHEPTVPNPWDWINEPPRFASGSNTPSEPTRPKRVSTRTLDPPAAGDKWHATHDTLLNTGPSPSAGSSAVSNSSFPASKRASRSADNPGSGSPSAVVAPASCTTTAPFGTSSELHAQRESTQMIAVIRMGHLLRKTRASSRVENVADKENVFGAGAH